MNNPGLCNHFNDLRAEGRGLTEGSKICDMHRMHIFNPILTIEIYAGRAFSMSMHSNLIARDLLPQGHLGPDVTEATGGI